PRRAGRGRPGRAGRRRSVPPPRVNSGSGLVRTCNWTCRFGTTGAVVQSNVLGGAVPMLLDRFDPFLAEFDRVAQRTLGTADGAGMPMDVIRRGDELLVRFDLPGVPPDKIGLTVENHLL